jgi:hypothetical protein
MSLINPNDPLAESLVTLLGKEEAEAVIGEILTGYEVKKTFSQVRQVALARAVAGGHRSMEGLGQNIAVVDETAYYYWQGREPGCWGDKKFLKEFLRDNPACRVPYQPKATVLL